MQDDTNPPLKGGSVFVRNLSFETTDQDLETAFEDVGYMLAFVLNSEISKEYPSLFVQTFEERLRGGRWIWQVARIWFR